jgi:hypothetical protein
MSPEGQAAATIVGAVLDGRCPMETLLGEGGMGAPYDL